MPARGRARLHVGEWTIAREDFGTRAAAGCSPADRVWLALLPCAALVLAAVVLLGPPLGDALLAPRGIAFSTNAQRMVLPEPTEHARYLLAALGPLLLAVVALRAPLRPSPAAPRALALLVASVQTLFLVALAACLWIERTNALTPATYPPIDYRAYFTTPTLVLAGAVALGLWLAVSRPALLRRAAALARDTPPRRVAAIALAVVLLAAWLLSGVNSETTIGSVPVTEIDIKIWMNEAMSVLNGRPPLVDLNAQYAQLLPYASAAAMAALGMSVGVFAAAMLTGTAVAMLAVLGLLRRVAGSWIAAALLFAPFLATSFFHTAGTLENRYSPLQLYSLFPMRYLGPYVLAWATVRHLDGARPHGRVALLLLAWLVAINNVEFGLPALAGTLVALGLAARPWSWPRVGRLAADAALGLLGAVAAVSALTLAVAGSLPRFGLMLTFARMFAVEGFGMLPMRAVGLHLVLYATFAAAIATAALEAAKGRHAAVLTGALAWTGVFGLGAGSYFVGRSHPDVLINLFSAWALALALLLVLVVRAAAARPGRRASPAALGVFAAAGLALCSLAQTPTPWSQLDRLRQGSPALLGDLYIPEQVIAEQTTPGEPVAIIAFLGHGIAHDAGVVDVTPYADERLATHEQLHDTIAALREAGGTQVFLQANLLADDQTAALLAAGFRVRRWPPHIRLITFVDRRARGR